MIAERRVGFGKPVFIIAEAGVNHNGDVRLARQLVDAAKDAGADAVKFQSFGAERLVSAAAPKAVYQLQTTDAAESQLEMLRRLELSSEAYRELFLHCQARGILFLSTPFDEENVDLLDALGVPAFKVGSGDLTNSEFLRYVAQRGKPVILSTGMSTLDEVEAAVRVIGDAKCHELILLHCVSCYPADPAEANLRAMGTMAAAFHTPVGFSDHTLGMEVTMAAVALGACVIEKHITLDRAMPGPDHRASFEPEEFKQFCMTLRRVESSLGDGTKRPTPNERDTARVARRSLHAAHDLEKGGPLRAEDFVARRPGTGVSAADLESVLTRRLTRSVSEGEMLREQDLE